jgi:DUF4097 and DUF4098 domain-containing protein YvlB
MEYIRTFTREFDTGPEADLSVDGRAGAITVRGEETARVRIEVVARLWGEDEAEADDQAELIKGGIRRDGNRISIRAPALLHPRSFIFFTRGPRIDYQISVPKKTKATIANRSGRTEIEQIAGPLDVDSRSGRVSVREIGADVRVTSRSGSVQVESIGGSLTLESRSGSVRVSACKRDVSLISRSGSVVIEEVGGKLKLESRSGAVRYEGAVLDAFEIDVRSGLVRLAVDAERPFFLDAQSDHGAVRSDLPLRRGGGAPSADGPTLRVRTRSGMIHIVPR